MPTPTTALAAAEAAVTVASGWGRVNKNNIIIISSQQHHEFSFFRARSHICRHRRHCAHLASLLIHGPEPLAVAAAHLMPLLCRTVKAFRSLTIFVARMDGQFCVPFIAYTRTPSCDSDFNSVSLFNLLAFSRHHMTHSHHIPCRPLRVGVDG